MVTTALGGLWAEPRPAHAPVRVRRDWALAAVVVSWSVAETDPDGGWTVDALLPKGVATS
jgi:hypothetical protein